MRRFASLIFALLFVIICQAQVEHLTFMGIPIDGKIKDFQKELRAKGFVRTSARSKDKRIYNGSFSGYECKLFVTYNRNTSIVYSVAVFIPCRFKNLSELTYQNFKRDLIQKYEADRLKIYSDYYKERKELFKEDVEKGNLTRINSSLSKMETDGRESTTISITKPIISEIFKENKPNLELVSLLCEANIGRISISSQHNYEVEDDYKDYVMIIYIDSQNVEPIREANKADL